MPRPAPGEVGGATLLLEDALVLTLDERLGGGRLSVAVRDGRIAAVDEGAILRDRFGDAVRLDCSGSVLLPGLVNAHLHPEVHVLKGVVEELGLHDWADQERLDAALAYLGSEEGRWIQRAGIRAALADCLLGGTTCVATYGITAGADQVAADVVRELGLRGHLTIRDVEFTPPTPDRTGSLPYFYRLHAEEALTAVELERAAAAHRRGERLVMHAAETARRLQLVRTAFGTTTIRLLERYGLLSPRVLLSHAIHVDEEEMKLLAARGSAIVSSPTSEMKLSDGIAPIVEYVRSDVPVALGTDCAICNNSNDMLLEARQLGLVQKLRYGAEAVPAEQILRMATRGGALALGEGGEYGVIEAGRSADLILVATDNARLQPLVHRGEYSNIASNLVYAATGQDVTDVMVRGRWLVRERRLLSADASRIWEELGRAAEALYDRIL